MRSDGESSWTVMFADDIVMSIKSGEQAEGNLEMWRYVPLWRLAAARQDACMSMRGTKWYIEVLR